jgi:hypothetical protein
MAETDTTFEPAQSEQPEVSENFVQKLANRHPRTAKVLAITGVVTTAITVAGIVRTVRSNKDHLEAAGEHASEAMSELAATVDPASPEA